MSWLAKMLRPVGATRPQIEAWIDMLDRSEPDRSGWRDAFDDLKRELMAARKIRDLGRLPVVVAFLVLLVFDYVVARVILSLSQQSPDSGALLVCIVTVISWEFVVRRAFPVLDIEGRVAALLRYYGAKDVPQEEEVQ